MSSQVKDAHPHPHTQHMYICTLHTCVHTCTHMCVHAHTEKKVTLRCFRDVGAVAMESRPQVAGRCSQDVPTRGSSWGEADGAWTVFPGKRRDPWTSKNSLETHGVSSATPGSAPSPAGLLPRQTPTTGASDRRGTRPRTRRAAASTAPWLRGPAGGTCPWGDALSLL